MKKRILTAITVFVVALMMSTVGIAATEDIFDCPSNNDRPQYDYLSTDRSVAGNAVTYILNTVNNPGASVIEYCVYPTPGFTGSNGDLTAIYVGGQSLWGIDRPGSKTYFGFWRNNPPSGTGDPNNLPINGDTSIPMGIADYVSSDKLPTSEVVLFHINDPTECDPDNTCWRRPGAPPAPVPELGTMVLMSTGMLGLVLVSRRYR